MITAKDIIIAIDKNDYTLSEIVQILEVAAYKSGINTIPEMQRIEKKRGKKISINGILSSPDYRKLNIGIQRMCVPGLRDVDSSLPF